MTKSFSASVAASAALVCLLAATGARADVTYNYTGKAFATGYVNGTYPALQDTSLYGTSLTGAITFDDTVTSTFAGSVTKNDVVSWSLSSGPISMSSSTVGNLGVANFTFVDGAITSWVFSTGYSQGGQSPALETYYGDNTQIFVDQSWITTGDSTIGNVNYSETTNNGLGTFTKAAATDVPEPASLALLATGLFGGGLLRRRRS